MFIEEPERCADVLILDQTVAQMVDTLILKALCPT